ncbi:cancer-related nucleoside-triphosphatase isoform X2 [Wyeomyia smithii]|uniref:cancer-related nucleoside-triphosphatase isoform X2 n=1 Tax=Wyeomyia smithii TaxID=174621 RepID=UPI002467ED22|nr:cancer-related nucleoside-triphosphatase isoform X2 [Wyeomyia smithii]
MHVILITGMPGVGKTTIMRNLSLELRKRTIKFDGFYTEELRKSDGERIGFDIVTFDDKRAPLARVSEFLRNSPAGCRVGKYTVCVSEFESLALPALNERTANLLLLDEIGKMELKSAAFGTRLAQIRTRLAQGDSLFFIATIPLKATLPIVEQLKDLSETKLFHVTCANRNKILAEIVEATVRMIGAKM